MTNPFQAIAIVDLSKICRPGVGRGRAGEFAAHAPCPASANPLQRIGPSLFTSAQQPDLGTGLRRYDSFSIAAIFVGQAFKRLSDHLLPATRANAGVLL